MQHVQQQIEDHVPGQDRVQSRVQNRARIRPPSYSTPLPGAALYHPSGKLVLALIAVPFVATSVAGGILVAQRQPIPLWLPAAMGAWALTTPLIWWSLKTVRLSPLDIATGRPWQTWCEISWGTVASVEQRGWRIRVTSKDGMRIGFTPAVLHQGAELRATLLEQVAPRTLRGELAEEAVKITLSPRMNAPVAELPNLLRVRARGTMRLGAVLATLVALAVAGLMLTQLPPTLGFPLAGLATALATIAALLGVLAFSWLSQVVTLTDTGISARTLLSGHARRTQWADVVVMEHTPQWRAVRLTGKAHRVRFPGPGVMRRIDADAYRAFLDRYLRHRDPGVLEATRHWLW